MVKDQGLKARIYFKSDNSTGGGDMLIKICKNAEVKVDMLNMFKMKISWCFMIMTESIRSSSSTAGVWGRSPQQAVDPSRSHWQAPRACDVGTGPKACL